MWHIHLQNTPLYGNSTELQYFYVNVYVGSQRYPQSLIADTGSGVAAMPCKNYCTNCGKHLNSYFDIDESTSKYFYNCQRDKGCECSNNDLCKFGQSYGEGSSYNGFLVKDQIHFGEHHHPTEDAFEFSFGCVTSENNLFYTQDADGILGLSKGTFKHNMRPIYDVMKEKNLIEKRMFSLCLGKNGGYFQIGGYDGQSHLDKEVKWVPLLQTSQFKVNLHGVSMNNHLIDGSQQATIGFIDSGTTFTYFPNSLWNMLVVHFDWFCGLNRPNHCKGARILKEKNNSICFKYLESLYPDGAKSFFLSYPILNFHLKSDSGEIINLEWYPSEYLYRYKEDQYCLAVEKYARSEVIIGGTMMRQHNFIFDVDQNKVGIARASCNNDFNQIISAQEMIESGQRYGLDPSHNESLTQICDHRSTSSIGESSESGGAKRVRVEKKQEGTLLYGWILLIIVAAVLLILLCCWCIKEEQGVQSKELGDQSQASTVEQEEDSDSVASARAQVRKTKKKDRRQNEEVKEGEKNNNRKNYYLEVEEKQKVDLSDDN